MRQIYFELMKKTLSAYSDEHIKRYFNTVKKEGLTEHGFPRLTANIGILISKGIREDLLPLFTEMMDFCTSTIPNVKAANDFSVREIIACIEEIEKSAIASIIGGGKISEWKRNISTIIPERCYDRFAVSKTDDLRNWALFTGSSEYYRLSGGLGGNMDFIDLQIETQFPWFDCNGMYMDSKDSENRQPIMYDLVTRSLFAIILDRGYNGKHRERMDSIIKSAGELTLRMQSVSGEIPFGGRSNQFIHNECWLLTVYEYEIKRYTRQGNTAKAREFSEAAARALRNVEHWLDKEPIRHIKNRFDTATRYGCEHYAYFDKYMITAASGLFTANLISDGNIPLEYVEDNSTAATLTSRHFGKMFLKSGGYFLEMDMDADPHYDCSGVGRIHRKGAPSALCMSLPCPSDPVYKTDTHKNGTSLSVGVKKGDGWHFATGPDTEYEVLSISENGAAEATVRCSFSNGERVTADYRVEENGVQICAKSDGYVGIMLPAFLFDGETSTDINTSENTLTVRYGGYVCEYYSDSEIKKTNIMGGNRNGYYQAYLVEGHGRIVVRIEIKKDM